MVTEQDRGRTAQRPSGEQPESSAMGAARGALLAGKGVAVGRAAHALAKQVGAQEQAAACVSRDAELALQLMAQDAAAKGVSYSVALKAQLGPRVPPAEAPTAVDAKGKGKVELTGRTAEEQGTVLEWEHRLSTWAWRGSDELTPVVLQPQLDPVVEAAARARAMACFAERRPRPRFPNRTKRSGGCP
jgi:hypothetical protein